MNKKLSRKQILIHWVAAAALLALGCGFALVGVRLFDALGLPVWSDGDHGWNYVGCISGLLLVAGISVFNFTLSEKTRRWLGIVLVALVAVFYYASYYVSG